MTDASSAGPVAESNSPSDRPNARRLSVGALIGATSKIVGQAFCLAYVAPYQPSRSDLPAARTEDGRDPAW